MSKIWYGSFQNRILEKSGVPKEVKAGTGVTEVMYSDRRAFYVMSDPVKDKQERIKEVMLIRPKVKCNDYYAGDWRVESFEDCLKAFKENIQSRNIIAVKRTRRGTFTDTGRVDGSTFVFGICEEYQDPSF